MCNLSTGKPLDMPMQRRRPCLCSTAIPEALTHPNLTVKSTLQHPFHHLVPDLTTVKRIPYIHYPCREMLVEVELRIEDNSMGHIKLLEKQLQTDSLIILMDCLPTHGLVAWAFLPIFQGVISPLWLRLHLCLLLDL
jgi:hypothetical protein